MPLAHQMQTAYEAAADFANQAAEELNSAVAEHGTMSPYGLAQKDWIAEFERCEELSFMLVDIEDHDIERALTC